MKSTLAASSNWKRRMNEFPLATCIMYDIICTMFVQPGPKGEIETWFYIQKATKALSFVICTFNL